MAQLTITEAIKQSPIGRTRMYSHYIKNGLITVSVNSNGIKYIDSSEVLRVFGSMGASEQGEHVQSTATLNTPAHHPAHTELLAKTDRAHHDLVQSLKEQISGLNADKEFLQSQVVTLTKRLEAPAKPEQNTPAEKRAPVKRQSRISKWWFGLDDKK